MSSDLDRIPLQRMLARRRVHSAEPARSWTAPSGDQASFMNYTEEEQREVKFIAEYTALFYGPRFLQSSLPAEAPILDLKNIRDLRELRDLLEEELNRDPENEDTRIRVEGVQSNLENVYLHPEYLSPANIVFSLAGDMMADSDKKAIALAIWAELGKVGGKVDGFPFHPDYLKKADICSLWPEDVSWPDLSKFVGKYSLVLFHYLNMADEVSLSWLKEEPKEWHTDTDFAIFRDFVRKIDVTNDCAERQVTKHFAIFVCLIIYYQDCEACPGLHQGGKAEHLPSGVIWLEDCQVQQLGEKIQGCDEKHQEIEVKWRFFDNSSHLFLSIVVTRTPWVSIKILSMILKD